MPEAWLGWVRIGIGLSCVLVGAVAYRLLRRFVARPIHAQIAARVRSRHDVGRWIYASLAGGFVATSTVLNPS